MMKNNDEYCIPTQISLNICNIIHKTILSKFKNINKGKIGHLFGHGFTLNKIKYIEKKENDIFASTNRIFNHHILKNLLDYYITGDAFRYDDNFNKWNDYYLNKTNKNYIFNEIKSSL